MNEKYAKYDLETNLGKFEDKQTGHAITRISDGQVVGFATEDGMFQWQNGTGQQQ